MPWPGSSPFQIRKRSVRIDQERSDVVLVDHIQVVLRRIGHQTAYLVVVTLRASIDFREVSQLSSCGIDRVCSDCGRGKFGGPKPT